MSLDVIIILTSENCAACKLIKGDGYLDAQNTSRSPESWWTDAVFKDTMTAGTDRQRFVVYEFFHKIHPAGYSYITEFVNYCLNPETLKVEKHRYFEREDGKMGYQIDRNQPTFDPKLPAFRQMLLAVVPMRIQDYYAFLPSIFFVDAENYQKSLDRNGGESVIMHCPGNNTNVESKDGKTTYKISLQQTYVNVRMDEYAKKIFSGEVNLKVLPRKVIPVYDSVPQLDEKIADSKLFKPKKRKTVAWNSRRLV